MMRMVITVVLTISLFYFVTGSDGMLLFSFLSFLELIEMNVLPLAACKTVRSVLLIVFW